MGEFVGLIRDVVSRCWSNVFSKWGMTLVCLASLALRLNPLDWMGRARLESCEHFSSMGSAPYGTPRHPARIPPHSASYAQRPLSWSGGRDLSAEMGRVMVQGGIKMI